MAYISGAWENSTLICANHPENEDHVMTLKVKADSVIYACPDCVARLRITDFEKMLDHIAGLVTEADIEGRIFNPTGYKWTRNGIYHEVLSYEDGKMKVRVLDRKSLAGRKKL